MSSWLPIETAPRDGTAILIYVHGIVTEAWYDPLKVSSDHEGSDTSSGGVWVCADDQWQVEVVEMKGEHGVEYDDGPATHWQPRMSDPV